ncbi:MAG: hypothetical protein QOI90_3048 [Mycobacterium sp.]|jgi:hypothetical protein|nr:hypothetical protein [Mycobacterium sp.]
MNRKKTAALIGASTFTLLVGCGVPETPSPSASQGQEARDGKLTCRPSLLTLVLLIQLKNH